MSGLEAIQALGPAAPSPIRPEAMANALPATSGGGFGAMLTGPFETMDAKVANADRLVQQFALDDNVPLHQVTIALEEARLAVEFAMQVRTRFVEGYREMMNMQL